MNQSLGKVRIFLFKLYILYTYFMNFISIGKYHRGKHVEGQWVFGGVVGETGKCFLVPVEDRTANTLMYLIMKWIAPGSIIISDCWKAYTTIK